MTARVPLVPQVEKEQDEERSGLNSSQRKWREREE